MADSSAKENAAPPKAKQFLPLPPRSGPGARTEGPPVYFLPAVLLPQQKAFLEKRQWVR